MSGFPCLNAKPSNFWQSLLFLMLSLVLGSLVLIGMDSFDCQASWWLRRHSWRQFADLMGRSLFEGESFGASDLVSSIQFANIIALLMTWQKNVQVRWTKMRRVTGYILLSSLLTGMIVHLCKGVIARPRPYDLELTTLNSWVGVSQGLMHGWGRGSLPSGHTAQAMSLIAISFSLQFLGKRQLAIIWSSLVIIFALVMALARVMEGAHWPSDTCLAILISWACAKYCSDVMLRK